MRSLFYSKGHGIPVIFFLYKDFGFCHQILQLWNQNLSINYYSKGLK